MSRAKYPFLIIIAALLLTSFNKIGVAEPIPGTSFIVEDNAIFSSYRVSIRGLVFSIMDDPTIWHGIGSAVAFNSHQLITANHVSSYHTQSGVEYAIDIYDADGVLSKSVPAEVVKEDADLDLAMLEVKVDLPFFTKFEGKEDFSKMRVGQWNYTIGAHFGMNPYVIKWGQFVSRHDETLPALCMSSAVVAPGSSGGAIYDASTGLVCGIVVRGNDTLTLFVPCTTVNDFIVRIYPPKPKVEESKPEKHPKHKEPEDSPDHSPEHSLVE